jgi:hypothetical protein
MSRGCPGLHCPGCSGGGGGRAIAALVTLAIIGAVIHAIWHTIVEAGEIIALVLASAIGAAALAGVTYGALQVRARVLEQRRRRPVPVRGEVIRLGTEQPPALEASRPAGWPLPGWWDEVRPHIGHDDERR